MLRRNVMQGPIAVTFRREPSYFHAAAIQGEKAEIYKGVDTARGVLAGLGGRFTLPAYVNGQRLSIGYLADLRVEAAYRGGLGLRRAYDFLRARHEADPLPFYTTMILQGNEAALRTIAANRPGMPRYRPQGFVHSPMIPFGFAKKAVVVPGVEIARGRAQDRQALFAFLAREHARRQFAPCYTAADMGTARLRGLNMEDFWLAWRGGEIVGALAVWDQHAFRQIHVESYHDAWRWLKPLYNAACRLTPLVPLPEAGAAMRYFYVGLVAVAGDDLAIFRALLRSVYRQYRHGRWHYMVCALHERDPLLPALREYRHIAAGGHLFTV